MQIKVLSAVGALFAGTLIASAPAAAAPIACTAVAATITGTPFVKSANSQIIPAGVEVVPFPPGIPPNPYPAHCQVDILYGENAQQNINIRVGLPLNSLDGGTGGVQGAWNGRTQGIGGGGCAGSLSVFGPVRTGYAGSGNDTGHSGGDCEPGVNLDGTYNLQFINDFIRNGMKQQVLFMKSVANTYYGMAPVYNYWNGCSTGGRQGYVLAQELPKELDGILANAPAIYWTRFQTAQMWGQITMKDLVGAVIPNGKFTYATNAAISACDGNDGVVDGIIDDPRTCNFSANTPALICVANGGSSVDPNCLTPAEATAINRIWDGPRNPNGQKVWFGLDRGTQLGGFFSLNDITPFPLGVTQFHWDEHDRNFDWRTVTMFGAGGTMPYAQVAQDGSRNIADVTDTFGDLKKFKKEGGKLLTMVGTNDQLIMPRGVIHYYRLMADKFGGFTKLQEFYRLFRAPGVAHCAGGAGPQPQNLFAALVNWVENGVAPGSILAQGGAVPARTRKLCPYPQTAIYNGSGSTDDQANFTCGGNLETNATICADTLVKYKHELAGKLDFKGTKLNEKKCGFTPGPWQ